jgi:hypothetical protein
MRCFTTENAMCPHRLGGRGRLTKTAHYLLKSGLFSLANNMPLKMRSILKLRLASFVVFWYSLLTTVVGGAALQFFSSVTYTSKGKV